MVDFMFIGAFTNYTLIKRHLYEENLSLLIDEKTFMEQYKKFIIKQEHNFLYINGKCEFSFHVEEWNLSTFDRNKAIGKGGAIKLNDIDKTYKIKQKIKDKNEVRKLENQLLWRPNKPKNTNIQIKFNKSRK